MILKVVSFLIFLGTVSLLSQRVPTGLYDVQENSPHMPIRFKINNTGQIGQCGDSLSAGITYNGVEYIRNLGFGFFNRSTNPYTGLLTFHPSSRKSSFTPCRNINADDVPQYSKVNFSTDFNSDGTPKDGKGYPYPLWKRAGLSTNSVQWIENPISRKLNSNYLLPDVVSDEDIAIQYTDYVQENYDQHPLALYKGSTVFQGMTVTQILYTSKSEQFKNILFVRLIIANNGETKLPILFNMICDVNVGGKANTNTVESRLITFKYDAKRTSQAYVTYAWNRNEIENLGYVVLQYLGSKIYSGKKKTVMDTSKTWFQQSTKSLCFSNSEDSKLTRLNSKSFDLDTLIRFEADSTNSQSSIRLLSPLSSTELVPGDTMEAMIAIHLGDKSIRFNSSNNEMDFSGLNERFIQVRNRITDLLLFDRVLNVESISDSKLSTSTKIVNQTVICENEFLDIDKEIRLYDLLGNVVFECRTSENVFSLESALHSIPNGLYFCTVSSSINANSHILNSLFK